jgi:transcriptional regulator with XRE-family HTH domain
MLPSSESIGELLKHWRLKRRFSQLDLACEAGISTRHLSFVETGRSAPSRDMVLHLAEQLDIPLRERNGLLLAAGFAPIYGERGLHAPEMSAVRAAVERVIEAHEPYPALAVDRCWNLIAANRALGPLIAGAAAALLEPPVNVMKLAFHPEGIARRIVNFDEWRTHLLARLRHQVEASADPRLASLLEELSGYPHPKAVSSPGHAGLAVPLRLETDHGVLTFLSTTMVFGAPLDVTLAELAVELFLPADAATADIMRKICAR